MKIFRFPFPLVQEARNQELEGERREREKEEEYWSGSRLEKA
jgi:hypothetical protein